MLGEIALVFEVLGLSRAKELGPQYLLANLFCFCVCMTAECQFIMA